MAEADWAENPEIVRAHLVGDDPDLETFSYCEEKGVTVCAHMLKSDNSALLVEIGEEHPCDSENICTCSPRFITLDDLNSRLG